MTDEHDFFVPERIDEQIDQLCGHDMRYRLPRPPEHRAGRSQGRLVREAQSMYRLAQEREEAVPGGEARMIEDLWRYYQDEQQEDVLSLERAWSEIVPRFSLPFSSQFPLPDSVGRDDLVEGRESKQERQGQRSLCGPTAGVDRKGKIWRRSALLIVALVLLALMGGVTFVVRLRQRTRIRDSFLSTNR